MSNKEKTVLEEYCELLELAEPISLEAQEATIRRWLRVFDTILSQDDFSENDERCIIEAVDKLLTTCCPDIPREDIRKEVYKIYNNLNLSPKSDRMKFFLG